MFIFWFVWVPARRWPTAESAAGAGRTLAIPVCGLDHHVSIPHTSRAVQGEIPWCYPFTLGQRKVMGDQPLCMTSRYPCLEDGDRPACRWACELPFYLSRARPLQTLSARDGSMGRGYGGPAVPFPYARSFSIAPCRQRSWRCYHAVRGFTRRSRRCSLLSTGRDRLGSCSVGNGRGRNLGWRGWKAEHCSRKRGACSARARSST